MLSTGALPSSVVNDKLLTYSAAVKLLEFGLITIPCSYHVLITCAIIVRGCRRIRIVRDSAVSINDAGARDV